MSLKKEKCMGTTADVLEKLRGLDPPKLLAIVDGFGGKENLEAWLRGEKEMTLQDVVRLLVDKTGRLIPAHLGITAAICDENRNFNLNRMKEINYAEILIRYQRFFPPGTIFFSAEEFAIRAEAEKAALMKNPLLRNLFNHVAWPSPFPQHEVQDMGKSMDEFFLPAAMAAYADAFPGRKFNIYCGEMAGKILPLSDYNGYDRMIAMMKNGPGVAWYFPNPMQGFSVDAQREAGKMILQNCVQNDLPYKLILNGPIEPALALVGFTGEIARDFNTPGYDCPAFSWRSAGLSLYFKAYDGKLDVYDYGSLGDAHARYSGGLVLLG